MQIFTPYITPFITWLHAHPEQALLLTMVIAFLESLAIIGSIIPGSVTMTAIGILAGSGVLRIDLTFLAATVGAVLGDGISYLLGAFYSERLTSIWPFNHYPNLLAYGQIYFEKHGGKSVLIGRFVGPLRSIIPVIAGMLHMPKWRFFLVNTLSGIGWAVLYVTPGVLIGAASHELSPEHATRLVGLVLLILVMIWLLTIGIKALFMRSKVWIEKQAHTTWCGLLKCRLTTFCCQLITPKHEKYHANTTILCFSLLCFVALFFLFVTCSNQFHGLDQSVHFFFQSIRTHLFEYFFAISQLSLTWLPATILYGFTLCFLLFEHDQKACLHGLFFGGLCVALLQSMPTLLPLPTIPQPHGILSPKTNSHFPDTTLTLAILCYLSVMLHNKYMSYHPVRSFLSVLLTCSLIFGGLGLLYLGEIWLHHLIATFALASVLCIGYWLSYRKMHPLHHAHSPVFSLLGSVLFLLGTGLSCNVYLNQTIQDHQIYHTQHIISHAFWWHQDQPLIPLYSRNITGKINGVFNIQYVGNIHKLELTLKREGWVAQNASLLQSVIKRLDKRALPAAIHYLYLHRPPALTLVHTMPHHMVLRLQLWQSNYYILSFYYPIWVGHVQKIHEKHPMLLLSQDEALEDLSRALNGFTRKRSVLPLPRPLSLPHLKHLLLIQDPSTIPVIQSELFLRGER